MTALMAAEVGGIEVLERRLEEWKQERLEKQRTNGKPSKLGKRTAMTKQEAQKLMLEMSQEDSELDPRRKR